MPPPSPRRACEVGWTADWQAERDCGKARADFTAVTTCPKMRLCVALAHPAEELRAYERCNLHGTWVGRKAIRVESD